MLSDLESNAWLSDKRFAEQYIFSKKIKYGIKKIAYELKISLTSPYGSNVWSGIRSLFLV
jgi:hypothetical protein